MRPKPLAGNTTVATHSKAASSTMPCSFTSLAIVPKTWVGRLFRATMLGGMRLVAYLRMPSYTVARPPTNHVLGKNAG
jgi:hypothetical protein